MGMRAWGVGLPVRVLAFLYGQHVDDSLCVIDVEEHILADPVAPRGRVEATEVPDVGAVDRHLPQLRVRVVR